MTTAWFLLIALTLTVYVVLDGFDFGVGMLHLVIAKSDEERRTILRSIGPFWDGNEVWLLAAGGTLFMAFPRLYAASFSGFYLPLMIVLWLIILRAISLEFRSLLQSSVWRTLLDAVFALASLLLAIFLGTALGNVVRGVGLDARGTFFAPLWTTLGIGPEPGIIDWYTVTVGLTAAVALALHGSAWLILKTEGELQGRARRLALPLAAATAALTLVMSVMTFLVQPNIAVRFRAHPSGVLLPLLALVGLVSVVIATRRRRELAAFAASSLYLVGMLAAAAFGVYPYVLPAALDLERSLSIHNAAAPAHALGVGLAWWIPGMLLVVGYTLFVYRHFAGKVRLDSDGH